MEKNIFLLLGTNLGNRAANLTKALQSITLQGVKILAVSSIYETEAWGYESNNVFFNQAVQVEFNGSPQALLRLIKGVEKEMGRIKNKEGEYEDRLIDIDILLFGDKIVEEEDLQIPHPLMLKREFVLHPLSEIAAQFIHPIEKKEIMFFVKNL